MAAAFLLGAVLFTTVPVWGQDLNTLLVQFITDMRNGTLGVTSSITSIAVGDGAAGAPSVTFASETTLGFRRSAATVVTLQGHLIATSSLSMAGASGINFNPSLGVLYTPSAANFAFATTSVLIGSQFKVDALPTIASGFGTNPAVTAGSTPLAGSVNVGTGTPGTGGVVAFNGTAFPSAPFVVCMNQTTLMAIRCTATTTQLTIAATALTASDVVDWIAISSK